MSAHSKLNSAVFTGWVRHRRFSPKQHQFRYPLYMLALDLDELATLDQHCPHFRLERFAPLSFRRSDYLGDPSLPLKQAILKEVEHQGGDAQLIDRVVMVGQVQCFGFYFSPINLFFCYQGDQTHYLLAEVNNTPWGERCCYLVDTTAPDSTSAKKMHVSPFMSMAMRYHWTIQPPADRMSIHIENHPTARTSNNQPVFDATMVLQRQELSRVALRSLLIRWPLMPLSIVRGIYWQALRLMLKRIPFIPYPNSSNVRLGD